MSSRKGFSINVRGAARYWRRSEFLSTHLIIITNTGYNTKANKSMCSCCHNMHTAMKGHLCIPSSWHKPSLSSDFFFLMMHLRAEIPFKTEICGSPTGGGRKETQTRGMRTAAGWWFNFSPRDV